jgi:hypothetical protein
MRAFDATVPRAAALNVRASSVPWFPPPFFAAAEEGDGKSWIVHGACARAVEADADGSFDAPKAGHLISCRAHELPPEPAPGAPYGAGHIAFRKALDRVLLRMEALKALFAVPPPGSVEPYFAMPTICYLPVADMMLVREELALLKTYAIAREAHSLLLSERHGLRAIMAECPPPPTEGKNVFQIFAYKVLRSKSSAKKANELAHQRVLQSPTSSTAAKFSARLAAQAAEAEEAAEAEGDGESEGDPDAEGAGEGGDSMSRLVAKALAQVSAPHVARAAAAAASASAAADGGSAAHGAEGDDPARASGSEDDSSLSRLVALAAAAPSAQAARARATAAAFAAVAVGASRGATPSAAAAGRSP